VDAPAEEARGPAVPPAAGAAAPETGDLPAAGAAAPEAAVLREAGAAAPETGDLRAGGALPAVVRALAAAVPGPVARVAAEEARDATTSPATRGRAVTGRATRVARSVRGTTNATSGGGMTGRGVRTTRPVDRASERDDRDRAPSGRVGRPVVRNSSAPGRMALAAAGPVLCGVRTVRRVPRLNVPRLIVARQNVLGQNVPIRSVIAGRRRSSTTSPSNGSTRASSNVARSVDRDEPVGE
jgi:hypothetical protein